LFDERLKSPYLETAGTSTQCIYQTLPFVDGYNWGKPDEPAGLRLVQLLPNGKQAEITCKNLAIKDINENELLITWALPTGEKFTIHFFDNRFEVVCQPKDPAFKWALQLNVAAGTTLPFTAINQTGIDAVLDGFAYSVKCTQGHFEKAAAGQPYVFSIFSAGQKLVVKCDGR
jgi:hypothetical protein